MKTLNYESPEVEILEVEVEQGFAASKTGVGVEDATWDPEVTF